MGLGMIECGRHVRATVRGVRFRAVFVAVAVLVATLASCSSPPSARDRHWEQDIAYLARELPRVHVDGVGMAGRPAWYAAAARLEAQVPRLTNGQVIVGLLRMVAMIHDDETNLYVPSPRFY